MPVRQYAGAIAGAVHPRAGRSGERVGDEPLGRLSWLIEVSPSDAGAADVDLARHADGREVEVFVEHVDAGVLEGPAQRWSRRASDSVAVEIACQDTDGRLGRTIVIEDHAARRERRDRVDDLPGRRLTAHD